MLGFIMHADSPRNIEPKMAKEIVEWLHGPKYVGVFVDKEIELINDLVDMVGFEMIQLHGSESPWECSQIIVPVIKAIGVDSDATIDSLSTEIEGFLPYVQYILLDTKIDGKSGGTGRTFDWSLASTLAKKYPIILSGGLNPDNIVEAIEKVMPAGVDLSSGLEERPGKKDLDKIEALFENYPEVS